MLTLKEIFKTHSKKLNMTEEDIHRMIGNTLLGHNKEEDLLNLLGIDNLDDIAFLIQNKEKVLETLQNNAAYSEETPLATKTQDISSYNHNDTQNIDKRQKPTILVKDNYVEIIIPSKTSKKNEPMINIQALSPPDRRHFNYLNFNYVQSRVFNTAYTTNKSFLVSAPTGCGKTDIALITILKALKQPGKIVYIVPMKALATEITSKLKNIFSYDNNVKIIEYTGDTKTDKNELNLANILVATPEKFDVTTRKHCVNFFISLLIIDEIHILHDRRGSVIESIVCRMFRNMELNQRQVRIVGLSATLPNHGDVARFIQAEDCFYFDASYRPVPLEMHLIGVRKWKDKVDDFLDAEEVVKNIEKLRKTAEIKDNIAINRFNINEDSKETLKNIEKLRISAKSKEIINKYSNNKNSEGLINNIEKIKQSENIKKEIIDKCANSENSKGVFKNIDENNLSAKCKNIDNKYTNIENKNETLTKQTKNKKANKTNKRSYKSEYNISNSDIMADDYVNLLDILPECIDKIVCTEDKENKTIKDKYNDILVSQMKPFLEENHQILIFVTSRKETDRTRIYLQKIFPKKSFNIHHAGLPRRNRIDAENRFRKKETDVLVTTNTLAWGVNLPARVVFIKSTTFYCHDTGKMNNLSILDILQIFGRAGRIQYDTVGYAYLITDNKELSNYYNLINNKTLVESKLLYGFIDILNTEIYLKNITNLYEAIQWMKSTFLFIRMLKAPIKYGFTKDEIQNCEIDKVLAEYICIAIAKLVECKLITTKENLDTNDDVYTMSDLNIEQYVYDLTLSYHSTPLGRIASFHFISHETILLWLESIPYIFDQQSMLEVLFSSIEFKHIVVRDDEVELLKQFSADFNIEFEEIATCKLLILFRIHQMGLRTYSLSLSCDQTFMLKNMERLVLGLQEIIIVCGHYMCYNLSCEIEKVVFGNKTKVNEGVCSYTQFVNSVYFHSTMNTTIIQKIENNTIHKITRNTIPEKDETSILLSSKKSERSKVDNTIKKTVKREEHPTLDTINEILYITHEKSFFIQVPECKFKVCGTKSLEKKMCFLQILYQFGMHSCIQTSWSLFTDKVSCSHFNIIDMIELKAEIYDENLKLLHNNDLRHNPMILTEEYTENLQDHTNTNDIDCNTDTNIDTDFENNINININSNDNNIDNEFFTAILDSEHMNVQYNPNSEGAQHSFYCGMIYQLDYEEVDNVEYKEKQKIITRLIAKSIDSDNTIIIVPDKHQVQITVNDLKTLLILKADKMDLYDVTIGLHKKKKKDGIIVVDFVEAIKKRDRINGNAVIYFKGIQGFDGIYAMYDIMRVVKSNVCVVYETKNIIDFCKSLENMEK